MTNTMLKTSLSEIFAIWLLAGLCFVVVGVISSSLLGIPLQQLKFNEFIILFQGLVFLCAGIWALGFAGLNAELGIVGGTGVGKSCAIVLKYFLFFLLAATIVIGILWLAVVISPQAMESLNKDYSRVANEISQQKEYLFGTVFRSHLRTAVYLLGTCFLVPVEEEIFFRRFFYTGFKERLGTGYAVGISSVIFGIVHPSSPLLGIAMGVFLALIYEKHKNLLINIATHGLVNFSILIAKDIITPMF